MAPKKCTFCSIACNEDPKTTLLYQSSEEETDPLVVFKDIKPAAEHHYLVCPKIHIKDAKALKHRHISLVEKMVEIGKQVLEEQGGDSNEARIGFHWPPFCLISHVHLHLICPQSEMGFLSRQIFKQNSWWFTSPEYMIDRLKAMPVEES